jgi:hypothetical protein
MKKYLLLILLLVGGMAAKAQNIQIHYDFGSALYENDLAGKPKLTTTVEMFKADKWGSTYFFVDMDYNLGEGTAKKGISCAYWEISRELRFWEGPLSAHVEYNGGVTNAYSLENCYLVGPTYTHNSADFSRGFTFSAMYKYIQHCAIFNGRPNNFQLTGTWYLNFAGGKGTFTGFADWWKQDNAHGKFIFLSEPQIWLNLNKFKHVDDAFKLSIGSEWELSDNFSGRDGFYCCPTLAVKWTFN